MKLIEPSVKIIYPQTIDDAVMDMSIIEYAARTCYDSTDKMSGESYNEFVSRRIRSGHTAPLEFGRAVFEIVCSRAAMAELTRHRHASFCVQSQRYVNYTKSGDMEFIKPTGLDDAADQEWKLAIIWAESGYKNMIAHGVKPQDARTVFPNAKATKMVMGANLREWRQILALRCAPDAYPETRQVANMILRELKRLYGCCFEDMGGDEA